MKKFLMVVLTSLFIALTGQMALATDYQAINAMLSGGAVIDGSDVKITSSGGAVTFTGLPSTATTITVYYHTSSNAEANLSFNQQYNATVANSTTGTTTVDPKGSYAKTTYSITVNTIVNDQAIWIEKISDGITIIDETAPTVNIDTPAEGTILSGETILSATASDNIGVTKVEFYQGTTLIGSTTTSPYSVSWNTAGVANGSYPLIAKAYDGAGNIGASRAIGVTVNNTVLTGLTVHFKRPSSWGSAIRIHYWNVTPSSVPNSGTWPGLLMTSEGDDWYTYTVAGATGMSIVFNDGSGNQTADLSRSNTEGWYYTDNKWYDTNPSAPDVPAITASPVAGTYLTAQTVTLTGSNSGDIIYYTTDGTTPTINSRVYSMPISVSASCTINAFGVNVNGQTGSIASFAYLIDPEADLVSPTIAGSPAAGHYDSATWVTFTIMDNKPATTIAYYTSDGSTPTTASPVYAYGNAVAGLAGPSLNITETATLQFLVVDGAGNETTAGFTYHIGKLTRNDFRQETIYFVMTSRFYDGDPDNNVHCWDDSTAGNPDTDPAWRGDFKGLIQKLDYIKALGFSAIWITPVVKNSSGYDYHGYHAINFRQVDPRYLSADTTYQNLIDAAHAKGLKVIQDIVLNHSSNFGEENLFPMFQRNEPTSLNDTLAASVVKLSNPWLPANYDSLTPDGQYQARINAMKEDASDTKFIYHHQKSLDWEGYTVETGQIAGDCVDLNTENPMVAQYLTDAYTAYIDMGVDAFRIDTVKHISRLTFNQYFIPALLEHAGTVAPNFYIFGELCSRYRQVWNSGLPPVSTPFYTWKESQAYPWGDRVTNESSTWQHWNDNTDPATQPTSINHLLTGNTYHTPDWSMRSGLDQIDFPMHWNFANARDAFNIALTGDHYYNDATWNVVYVDSHDYAPDGAPENQRFALGQDVWAENLSLMFTFRGIPCIFYGSEIEFQKGKVIDPGPNAPLTTTGRAYFGENIEGSVTVTDYGQYSEATGTMATSLNYPLARHIQRLNLIRRAIPALQMGQYSVDGVSGSGMAFKRRYTDTADGIDSFVCVTISGDATFSAIPNGTYVDAVTGDSRTVTNGTLSISCSEKGNMRVYVLDLSGNPAPGKIGANGPYLK